MAKEDEDGVWKTIRGRRIFIRKGESLTDAMRKSGKFEIHGPDDPKIKKANKPYEKEDAKRAKQYEKDQELRKTIQNKKELRKRLEQMKKSGKFKEILGEPSPTKKSIKALNEIDKLAGDNKYLQKKGRELGLKDFKQFLKDNPGYSKNQELPERFKDGFRIQSNKYSDENKMSLVEDGSGVRLIYDGKDTGTVLRNDLSDREITSLRNAGKIQNMSEYLDEKYPLTKRSSEAIAREERELKAKYMALPEDKRVSAYAHGENWKDLVKRAYSLDEKETNALHNHLESNIKSWREQGMSDKQILDMVSDRVKVSRDDGLYDIKGLDIRLKKEAILDEYQNYIQNKISTKTKSDYDKDLRNISSKAEGTYDLSTGNPKSYQDGYQVTFSMTNMGFDDNTYKSLIEKFKTHDHGTVDAGNFDGYSEVSFNVTDIKKAAKLATKYNQVSIWDWKNGKVIPTKGTGKYEDYKPESVSDKIKSQRKEKK